MHGDRLGGRHGDSGVELPNLDMAEAEDNLLECSGWRSGRADMGISVCKGVSDGRCDNEL